MVVKDLLARFRRRSLDNESKKVVASCLYNELTRIRRMLVEAFDYMSERRLRELYDIFSLTMLHFDKLHQLMRRLGGSQRIENCLEVVPMELLFALRKLESIANRLRLLAPSASMEQLRYTIIELSNAIDEIARIIGSVF